MLADAGFWADADDIFYVRRDELQQVIYDYGNGWAVGAEAIGPVATGRRRSRAARASSRRSSASRRRRR